MQCVAVCRSVSQCVAVCCSVLQCVAVCCSVLQCVAVCCSVLQCVAVGSAPVMFQHAAEILVSFAEMYGSFSGESSYAELYRLLRKYTVLLRKYTVLSRKYTALVWKDTCRGVAQPYWSNVLVKFLKKSARESMYLVLSMYSLQQTATDCQCIRKCIWCIWE